MVWQMMTETELEPEGQERLTLFDDRYGVGAFDRLLALLRQPCVSFAAIASHFGVTRERVRQWHMAFLPDAPRGRERRRLCQIQQARRRLLADRVFKTFYRQARASFPAEHVSLIRTRDGLRSRAARIQGYLVAVKKARRRANPSPGRPEVHVLAACRRAAAFVYYQLDDDNFLFVPHAELPVTGTTYLDSPASKYRQYRNNFAALDRRALLGHGELTTHDNDQMTND